MKPFADLLTAGEEQGAGVVGGVPPNPPGRRELHFRVGTYRTFFAAMARRLRTAEVPDGDFAGTRPLEHLDLSERHNWLMALLGSWAAVGDVLTFYQERVLNEGFLRTAVEDLSVRELVLTVGYVPAPGVAGSAALAFGVVDSLGIPPRSQVPAGSRVLSMPVEEDLPQTFETAEALVAHAELNLVHPLTPVRERHQVLGSDTVEVRVVGTPAGLVPGAALAVLDPAAGPAVGAGPEAGRLLRIVTEAKPLAGETPGRLATRVRWQDPLGAGPIEGPRLVLMRQRSTLFGHNAPPWDSLPEAQKRAVQPILGGVSASDDRGTTVRPASGGLPAKPVKALAIGDDGTLYATLSGLGLYRSTDGGGSWAPPARAALPLDVLTLAAAPGGHLYAGTGTGVYRTTDRGESWSLVGADPLTRRPLWRRQLDRLLRRHVYPRLPETPVRALWVASGRGRVEAWAGTDAGVFRTRVPSAGWLAVNGGLPGESSETGLAEAAVASLARGRGSGELYAATDAGVFHTRSRGRRWRAVNLGLPGRRPWSGTASPVAAVASLDDPRGGEPALFAGTGVGVYRSLDGGESWQPASRGLAAAGAPAGSAAAVTALVAVTDPETLEATVYAGTGVGLFRSTDRGESWSPVTLPSPDPMVAAVAAAAGGRLAVATPFDGFAVEEWPGFHLSGRTIDLSSVVPAAVAGGWVALVDDGADGGALRGVYRIERASTARRSDFGLTATLTRLEVDTADRLVEFDLRSTVAHLVSEPLDLVVDEVPLPMLLDPGEIVVGSVLPPETGRLRRVIVAGKPVRRAAFTPAAAPPGAPAAGTEEGWLSLVATRVDDDGALRFDLVAADGTRWSNRLAAELIPEPAEDDEPEVAVEAFAERLEPSTLPPLAAEHRLEADDITVLALRPPPALALDSSTVSLYANVAPSNQGETAPDEVLGSGDATRGHQRFGLRKPPLTYVRDLETGEIRSTLRVWVNEVEWTEVPALYAAGPRDHVFMVRPDIQGRSMVVFGDGVHGARLPSGSENVWATYRSGVWPDSVEPGYLKLLQTRPLGLRSVTNPIASEPGSAPEPMDRARRSAPASVRTLERIVSLRDYSDFARTYPGLVEARAEPLWTGSDHAVLITLVPGDGRELALDDDLVRGLARAIAGAGSSARQVRLAGYRRVPFRVAARLTVDPRYRPEPVLVRATAALTDAFDFVHGRLGEPLPASRVISVLQAVEGVAAVDLDLFHRADEEPHLAEELETVPAGFEPDGGPRAAEMLVIDAPLGIGVTT